MRNEIWSLIAFQGAPSWYITLSPADNNPLSHYTMLTLKKSYTCFTSKSEKDSLIAGNPVASARFFIYDPGFH